MGALRAQGCRPLRSRAVRSPNSRTMSAQPPFADDGPYRLRLSARRFLWLVILSFATANAAAPGSLEREKIAYLINTVETLQGAQFIRNGKPYDAQAAAAHLRLKLRSAGARVQTAEDFIRLCASASSVSGIPYQISFADGHTISSADYLRQKLAEFTHQDHTP